MRIAPLFTLLAVALFGAGCSSHDTRPIPLPS